MVQFPRLLREYNEYRGELSATCPDEPNFQEMYEALGDMAAQEEIRLSNPKVQHCDKLPINARACIGCKLNPLANKKAATRELIEQNYELIELATELDDQAGLGLIRIEELNSTEMVLLRTARMQQRYLENEQLSKLIGFRVAESMAQVLSKMFGGK